MFYFDRINGKQILKSDILNEIEHFFTTKDSFLKTENEQYCPFVNENKTIISDYLNTNELICPTQTHSSNIAFAIEGKTNYPDTDSVILTNKKQAVYLNFADCTPIILYDKKQHIAAICHAGWRGTAQKITQKTISKMESLPKDIIAIIGPTISICCYSVKEDVFNQLKSTVTNFEKLSEIKKSQIYVDLKGINARQLEEIGVEKIDICPYCTSCNNDMFFSYRKENKTTNRHNAVIKL